MPYRSTYPHPHICAHTLAHTHTHTLAHTSFPSLFGSSAKPLVNLIYPPLVLYGCQVKEMSIHLPKWPPGNPVPRTEKMGRHPPTLSPQFSPQSPVTQALYSLGRKQILQQFLNHCGLAHYSSWIVVSSGNRQTHTLTSSVIASSFPLGAFYSITLSVILSGGLGHGSNVSNFCGHVCHWVPSHCRNEKGVSGGAPVLPPLLQL